MKFNSLWWQYKESSPSNKTKKDIKTDVLIIGGGITGMTTALFLKESDYKVTVIDKSKVGMGSTSLTTGKITILQHLIYQKLEKTVGYDKSYLYLRSQMDACNLVKDIIKQYNIDCDYNISDSYTFTDDENEFKSFDKEIDILKRFNIDFEVIKNLPINFPSIYGIKVKNQAVFNPIKYINNLKRIVYDSGIKIYEDMCAINIQKEEDHYVVETDINKITAKKVIVCTHYPFFIRPGLVPFKSHIEMSHVIASSINNASDFNAISGKSTDSSIRYQKDNKEYLIFAGSTYKMSKHIDYKQKQLELENKFKNYFDTEIDYEWMTHDLTTNDIIPLIGAVEKDNNNLLMATGFNKWGMSNGTLAGKILSDIIKNVDNEYIELFNPSRNLNIVGIKNFFIDAFSNGKIFLRTKICKNKSFYDKDVKMVKIDSNNYGIYIDENNKKHIVSNKCPHMGCGLIFNYFEKTWNCPCHGSKYDIDGNLLKGPSTKGISVEKKVL